MTRISVRWGGSELAGPLIRSEEHTSELQSQSNLVCRLLLEKKKTSRAPSAGHGAATKSEAHGSGALTYPTSERTTDGASIGTISAQQSWSRQVSLGYGPHRLTQVYYHLRLELDTSRDHHPCQPLCNRLLPTGRQVIA